MISALGPVALQLSDSRGRTTGRFRGAIEKVGILDTNFDQLPDAEFAFTKQDIGYSVNVAAEREGSLDLKVRVLGNGRVERTALYLGVPLGRPAVPVWRCGRVQADAAAAAGWPSLEVDTDGDGIFEVNVRPAAVLDASQSADTRPPELAIDSPAAGRAGGRSVITRWASDAETGMLFQTAVVQPETSPRVVAQGERVALSTGQRQRRLRLSTAPATRIASVSSSRCRKSRADMTDSISMSLLCPRHQLWNVVGEHDPKQVSGERPCSVDSLPLTTASDGRPSGTSVRDSQIRKRRST